MMTAVTTSFAMSRRHLLLALCLAFALSAESQTRIAFWNVENFFDTYNDTLTSDGEFTPDGSRHWTPKR